MWYARFKVGGIMALPQEKLREIIFQMLYSWDIASDADKGLSDFFMHHLKISRRGIKEAKGKMELMISHLKELDHLIQENTQNYSFDRISRVEKNILRFGIYEILYNPTLPAKVAIAESMRICRKFGTKESAKFVNAILDAIYKKHTVHGDNSTE